MFPQYESAKGNLVAGGGEIEMMKRLASGVEEPCRQSGYGEGRQTVRAASDNRTREISIGDRKVD
jgi:hypothetical protein